MFQKKNEKLQHIILIFSIVNIVVLVLAFIGIGSVLLGGILKIFTNIFSFGEMGGTIGGYRNLMMVFQIIMFFVWIIAGTNFFFTIYSVVEMVKFRTKYSIASSVLTIITSLGITFFLDLTIIPRMAGKVMWVL